MKRLIATLAVVASALAAPAWAAATYVLKIDGIDGESTADKYKSWIDLAAWSWGLSNATSAGSGTGGGSGKAVFQDFHWTQGIDSSVVPLFTGVATGKHFPKAQLDVLQSTGGQAAPYFQMIFSDVGLSSLNLAGLGGEERVSASLGYGKVEMKYRTQAEDGSFNNWISGAFDIKGGKLSFSGDPGVVAGLLRSGGDVNLAAVPMQPVPEPQRWALMIAGLALSAVMVRRRRNG